MNNLLIFFILMLSSMYSTSGFKIIEAKLAKMAYTCPPTFLDLDGERVYEWIELHLNLKQDQELKDLHIYSLILTRSLLPNKMCKVQYSLKSDKDTIYKDTLDGKGTLTRLSPHIGEPKYKTDGNEKYTNLHNNRFDKPIDQDLKEDLYALLQDIITDEVPRQGLGASKNPDKYFSTYSTIIGKTLRSTPQRFIIHKDGRWLGNIDKSPPEQATLQSTVNNSM